MFIRSCIFAAMLVAGCATVADRPDSIGEAPPVYVPPAAVARATVLHRGPECRRPAEISPPAQHTRPTVGLVREKKETLISVRADGVPIGVLVAEMARQAGSKLVVPRALGGRAVWAQMKRVRLESALFAIGAAVGLRASMSEDEWRLVAARDPKGLSLESPPSEPLVARVLSYAKELEDLAPLVAETMLSCHGSAFTDAQYKLLVLHDIEERVSSVERAVRTLDHLGPPLSGPIDLYPFRWLEQSSLTTACPAPSVLASGERHAGTVLLDFAQASGRPLVVGCGGGTAVYAGAGKLESLIDLAAELGLAVRPALEDRALEQNFNERTVGGVREADWIHDFRANPSGIDLVLVPELDRVLAAHPEKIEFLITRTATQAVRTAELVRLLELGRAGEVPGQPMFIARSNDESMGRIRRLIENWWTEAAIEHGDALRPYAPPNLEGRCAILREAGIDAHDAEQYERALDFYRRGLEVCDDKGTFLHELAWTLAAMGQHEEAAQSIIRAFLNHGGGRRMAGNLELLFGHLANETKAQIQSMGSSFEAPIYTDIPTQYAWFDSIACLGKKPVSGGRRGSAVREGSRFDVWQVQCPAEKETRSIHFNVDGDPRLRAFREELEALEEKEH